MVYMALPDGIIMLEIKNISIFKNAYVFLKLDMFLISCIIIPSGNAI
jgi:hypothetical protein